MKLLDATLQSCPIGRPTPTEQASRGLCLDKGYDYQAIRDLVAEQRFTPHIRTRGDELQQKVRDPSWRARRWVVEATHSWMNRWRSILIRWSKKPQKHDAFLHLAAGLIAMKKAHKSALQGEVLSRGRASLGAWPGMHPSFERRPRRPASRCSRT